MKLVHEVKVEVYSSDEARHTEKRDQCLSKEEAADRLASVKYQRNEYYCQFEEI